MTPEVRTIWLLTAICLMALSVMACPAAPQLTHKSDILGPLHNFSTRRVPARDLLDTVGTTEP